MFKKDGFQHLLISAANIPRVFVYKNMEDTIHDLMKPGYFNSQRILLLPDSKIEFWCKSGWGQMMVKENRGDVTMRPEFNIIKIADKNRKRDDHGRIMKNDSNENIRTQEGRPAKLESKG